MNLERRIDVLLVEDDPQDAELATMALMTGSQQIRVHLLQDGEAALQYMARTIAERNSAAWPRLVLLDLKLPKVGGFDVLHTLRSRKEASRLPVVILTSSAEEKDIDRAYDLGANSYVQKPVAFDRFCQVLAQVRAYWLQVNEGN